MDCYKIADIGFGIDIPGKQLSDGPYLCNYKISEDVYRELKDRVDIYVKESLPQVPAGAHEMGNKLLWEEDGRTRLAVPYGRCRCAAVFASSDWREDRIRINLDPGVYGEYSFNLNQLLALTGLHSPLLKRDALTLHAAFIGIGRDSDCRAVLFTGASGAGKSTQAELWRKFAGARLINGDRAALKYSGEDWRAFGIPNCGSSRICVNEDCPVSAIVAVEKGTENRIEEMNGIEKYRSLILATAFYQWDIYESRKVHELIEKLIREVPVARLVCRPDKDAVLTLRQYLEQQDTQNAKVRKRQDNDSKRLFIQESIQEQDPSRRDI